MSMNNSIFDFLDVDFTELGHKLDEIKRNFNNKYNNFINENVKKYDVTTDDGYSAFLTECADLRNQLNSFGDNIFTAKMISILDSVMEEAAKKYYAAKEEAAKEHYAEKWVNTTPDDLVQREVKRSIDENHGKLNTGKQIVEEVDETPIDNPSSPVDETPIDRPSSHITPKQMRSLWKLVDEYMEKMIIPHIDEDKYDEDMIDDMSCGLFEFASWILNHEDDEETEEEYE